MHEKAGSTQRSKNSPLGGTGPGPSIHLSAGSTYSVSRGAPKSVEVCLGLLQLACCGETLSGRAMPATNGRSVSYGNNSSQSSSGNLNPPGRRRSGFVGAFTAYFLFAPPEGPPQKSLLPSTSLAARRKEPSISVGHETPFQKSGYE
jgi:hypothetical protein